MISLNKPENLNNVDNKILYALYKAYIEMLRVYNKDKSTDKEKEDAYHNLSFCVDSIINKGISFDTYKCFRKSMDIALDEEKSNPTIKTNCKQFLKYLSNFSGESTYSEMYSFSCPINPKGCEHCKKYEVSSFEDFIETIHAMEMNNTKPLVFSDERTPF